MSTCPSGHHNVEGAAYCNACAAPLTPPAAVPAASNPAAPAWATTLPPTVVEQSGSHRRGRRATVIGVAGLAIVLGAGAAFAATGTAESRPNLRGSFTLFDFENVEGNFDNCQGTGGYDDVDAGMPVTIRNDEGDIVGSTSTRHPESLDELVAYSSDDDDSDEDRAELRSTLEDVDGLICTVIFDAELDPASFYEVEVGRRGSLSYRRAELAENGWRVSFSLGD